MLTAFDPVTKGIVISVAAVLAATPLVFLAMQAAGKLNEKLRKELWTRYLSWLVIAPLLMVPVLAGRVWTILGVGVLSLFCYREYARATGLFRHHALSATVALGIALLTFAALDHWYDFFVAVPSLMVLILAMVAVGADQPSGYIQRVALAVFGLLLFGVCLSHLGYFANDKAYRPIVLMIILCTELNDIFAFITGKAFGRRRLAPQTSPNKTIGGSVGSLVLTTALVAWLAGPIFSGTPLDHPVHRIAMGLIVSIGGQFGDLVLSSIKRDLGVKDLAVVIPGHGGLLDRFDSLLLVAPAMFHYVGYFWELGLDQPARLLSGGL
ncbi:MAG: phosphatidate cytidylyltransferase [Verrucomicrobia bacterium]|nr:phosphatidate cytidylyltransferase [Verrucomicrobiota bacterium]MDA1087846.1 phosphatidate cytidylyltransferase [Verrucomicrobiota bacterium]